MRGETASRNWNKSSCLRCNTHNFHDLDDWEPSSKCWKYLKKNIAFHLSLKLTIYTSLRSFLMWRYLTITNAGICCFSLSVQFFIVGYGKQTFEALLGAIFSYIFITFWYFIHFFNRKNEWLKTDLTKRLYFQLQSLFQSLLPVSDQFYF